ncbi:hypothetical protein OFM83_31015, partial [Escherichia coli]|nr:hypothetical protein [Escherichia coli]
ANQRLSEIPSTTLLYLLDIVVKEINSQDIQFDTMLSYYVKKFLMNSNNVTMFLKQIWHLKK